MKRKNYIYLGIIAILLFSLIRSCNPSITELMYKQNIAALTDSVRLYKTKNGDLVYEKAAFISESRKLKNLNRDLAEEIKWFKDNPIVVIKTRTKIKHDTIEVPVYPTKPGTWSNGALTQNFNWNLNQDYGSGNYRKLEGNFDVYVDTMYKLSTSKLKINEDEIGISFTTGLTENRDGLLEIVVKSNYPGFQVSSIDGVLIDPRESDVIKKFFPPKRWALGVYGGYGAYLDPVQMRIGTGVQLGIGIQYNIIQWNFKK